MLKFPLKQDIVRGADYIWEETWMPEIKDPPKNATYQKVIFTH